MAGFRRGTYAVTALSVASPASILARRLDTLLPEADGAMRAAISGLLSGHVQELVHRNWVEQVQACADHCPRVAAALHLAMSHAPDSGLFLASLGSLITPALLLSLPFHDRPALITILLGHPDMQLREQALDVLGGHSLDCGPLHDACAAWSRRRLVAGLNHLTAINDADRLALQKMLSAGGHAMQEQPAQARPVQARSLGEMLEAASNRQATIILGMRAGVALDIVETALGLRDPAMLVALCWKAGCDPAETLAVQIQLGRIPPDRVMRSRAGNCWPLDPAEMQRQIAILQDI